MEPSSSNIVRDDDKEFSFSLSLNHNDPLFNKKQILLERLGLHNLFQLKDSMCLEEVHNILKGLIHFSRIIHLNEFELYFGEDDGVQSYSPVNEMTALNSTLSMVDNTLSICPQSNVLQELRKATINMIHNFGNQYSMKAKIVGETNCDKENKLLQWSESLGARTSLQIAYVEGAGRGTIAKENLDVGDTVLEVPLSIVISEELVHQSNMYPILSQFDSMSSEVMLCLWIMREKHNVHSKFKLYFETLPEAFNTGLRFGDSALKTLKGILDKILLTKKELWKMYHRLFPRLWINHSNVFPRECYSWEQFMWASELLHSNAFRIPFADGKMRVCLIPIAGFINNTINPHIMHIVPDTNSLKFCLARPCPAGEECYISYGDHPSSHLITYYGFLPKGDNLKDVIPIDIGEFESIPSDWSAHMVRGTWLSRNKNLFNYGLPSPLLEFVHRALCGGSLRTKRVSQESLENEMKVIDTLRSTFKSMMEGLQVKNEERNSTRWDMKLAVAYIDLRRNIVSSVMDSCLAAREEIMIELMTLAAKNKEV